MSNEIATSNLVISKLNYESELKSTELTKITGGDFGLSFDIRTDVFSVTQNAYISPNSPYAAISQQVNNNGK